MSEYLLVQSDSRRIPLPDRSVDICLGSPPYIDARTYLENGIDLGISRDTAAWVDWMLDVTTEALRVSRGLVLWVVSGVTRDRNYQPGPEGLLWEWWRRGGECHCLRPVIWHRSGIPGSGGDQWFRGDTEYALAFKRPGKLPWANNVANGHTPKHGPGGAMCNRLPNGQRVRLFTAQTRRVASGRREEGRAIRPIPELSNPGNLFSTGAGGGGQLGSALAHLNEAPYPVDVPRWFIASHCPPGGLVLDSFGGSGTTADAAISLGRRAISMDLRRSQAKLAIRRIADSLRPVSRLDPPRRPRPLGGQGSLF